MTTPKTLQDIRIRDPFIFEPRPGSYLLFGTTDSNVWGGPATGFDVYRSDDLLSWTGPFPAFRPTDEFWSSEQFWAPEVHQHDGRYFMFATFLSADTGARGVGVLSSSSPEGPFSPWSDGPLTPAGIPSLDGTFHVDADGVPWLVYSRGAEGVPGLTEPISDGEMLALRLSDDLKRAVGTPILLFTATAAAWSRPMRFAADGPRPDELSLAEEPYFTDGPFLYRSENHLRMLWSSFGDDGYAMGVATSETGSVLGPWKQEERALWERNGGHGMLLRTSAGEDLLVLHTPNTPPHERTVVVPFSRENIEAFAGRTQAAVP